MSLLWKILADWDNDGIFEADEAGRLEDLHITRGKTDPWGLTEIGKATLVLENADGRFNPWNNASPLYPNVRPGRQFKIQCIYASATYNLFSGYLDDLKPFGKKGEERARVLLQDGFRQLRGRTTTVALMENVRTGAAIGAVLDSVGWPAGLRDLDTGADILDYFFCHGRSPMEIIEELAESERGSFFMAADGKATFVDRHAGFMLSSAFTLSQSTICDLADLMPWEAVKNDIIVKVYPRVLENLQEIWKLETTALFIAPGATQVIWAEFHDSHLKPCPARDVVAPVANTDYTANSRSDGTGTDLTAQISISTTTFSQAAKLVVTNNASVGAYMTLLRIRGRPVTAPNPVIWRREDAASQAAYGRHALVLDLPWQQRILVGRDLADYLIGFASTPRSHPTLLLKNYLPRALSTDLETLIRLQVAKFNIDADFVISRIEHKFGASPQELITEWWLLPADPLDYWILGQCYLGIDTRLGY